MFNWLFGGPSDGEIMNSENKDRILEERLFICPKCSCTHLVKIFVRAEPTDLNCFECKTLCWFSWKENRLWEQLAPLISLDENEYFPCK